MPSPQEMRRQTRSMVAVMREGGYYDAVMGAGPELDRVKRFLKIMAGESRGPRRAKDLDPEVLPVFPGISATPYFERKDSDPVVRLIESYAPRIRQELMSLPPEDFLGHDFGSEPLDGHKASGLRWRLFPAWVAGTRLPLADHCPVLEELLKKLGPASAHRWPFSYMMYSVIEPWIHLGYHSSTDMLRRRCHLGLTIPEGAVLVVAGQTRTWQEDRVLFLNDAFRHDAINRSPRQRAILIIDLWHPDLTPAEIEALEAGFRKSQVRQLFYAFHLREMVWGVEEAEAAHAMFQNAFRDEDKDPLIRRFWKRGF